MVIQDFEGKYVLFYGIHKADIHLLYLDENHRSQKLVSVKPIYFSMKSKMFLGIYDRPLGRGGGFKTMFLMILIENTSKLQN